MTKNLALTMVTVSPPNPQVEGECVEIIVISVSKTPTETHFIALQ